MTHYTYDCGSSGAPLFSVESRWIEGMASAGDHTEDARIAAQHATWHADDDVLRRFLEGYGAWDDLASVDRDTLRTRTIWLGGSDIDESPDEYRFEYVEGLTSVDT